MKSKLIISTWLITILVSCVTSAADRPSSQNEIKNPAPDKKLREYFQDRIPISPQQQPSNPTRDYNDHYPPSNGEGSGPQPTKNINPPPS